MPDTSVEAIIISLSTPEPFTSSSGKQLTKFTSYIQVGDEVRTGEALGFHYKNLKIGGVYNLLLRTNDDYPNANANIWEVTYLRDGAVENVQSVPTPQPTQTPKPVPTTQSIIKPDFGRRFQEWSTHARTAKMQATARVEILVDLVKEGKLLNDQGEAVTKLKIETVRSWYKEEYQGYWKELAESAPEDWFGALKEADNASS